MIPHTNRSPIGTIQTEKANQCATYVKNGGQTKAPSIVRRAQSTCAKIAILSANAKVAANGIVKSACLAVKVVAILCVADA